MNAFLRYYAIFSIVAVFVALGLGYMLTKNVGWDLAYPTDAQYESTPSPTIQTGREKGPLPGVQTFNTQTVIFVSGGVTLILLFLLNSILLQIQANKIAVQKDLALMKERLALALKNSRDGIFDWDLRSNHLYLSAEYTAMLGYEPHELDSSIATLKTLLHPDDSDEVWQKFDAYISGKTSDYSHIFRMRHKNGAWIWVHAKGKALFENGHPARFVGTHSDVTALKEAQELLKNEREKAESANIAKTNFLAHMSHEIRTPLTAISGIAEIFERNQDNLNEKQKTLITTLRRSTSILRELITGILDFSRIESGELALENQPILIDQLFEEIIGMVGFEAREKNIGFHVDYDAVRGWKFYGDPLRIRQILINLIGNALKFTEQGSVSIKAYKVEKEDPHKDMQQWLRVDIHDTGIGISPQHIDLIFEKFKQADSSVSRKYHGTGLGLTISRSLAQLMQGEITVQSQKGMGSTFSFSFPVSASESRSSDENNAPAPEQKKILLVEDYEGNVVVIGYLLEEMGYAFDVAHTGLQAIHLWQEGHYDLILMDVQMPEMDGMSATREIRRLEHEQSLPATPIIGMTAHAFQMGKDIWRAAGMNSTLPKPLSEEQLKAEMMRFFKAQPATSLAS